MASPADNPGLDPCRDTRRQPTGVAGAQSDADRSRPLLGPTVMQGWTAQPPIVAE